MGSHTLSPGDLVVLGALILLYGIVVYVASRTRP